MRRRWKLLWRCGSGCATHLWLWRYRRYRCRCSSCQCGCLRHTGALLCNRAVVACGNKQTHCDLDACEDVGVVVADAGLAGRFTVMYWKEQALLVTRDDVAVSLNVEEPVPVVCCDLSVSELLS